MWLLLNRLGVNQTGQHDIFGDVSAVIDTEFTQSKYLVKTSRADVDGAKIEYTWGPRARAEFSVKTVLALAAEIYGEDPNIWYQQLGLNAPEAAAAN